MNYRGYTARVAFNPESRALFGQVEHLRDVITFEASDVEALEREFHRSVDEYLGFCEEMGRSPEKPYSGRILVRMTPDLHRAISRAAEHSGVSMNGWIVNALETAAAQVAST